MPNKALYFIAHFVAGDGDVVWAFDGGHIPAAAVDDELAGGQVGGGVVGWVSHLGILATNDHLARIQRVLHFSIIGWSIHLKCTAIAIPSSSYEGGSGSITIAKFHLKDAAPDVHTEETV